METYAVNNGSRRLLDESSLAACAISASDVVLVALSGGADSTALLLSLQTLQEEGKVGGLFAAHLNHGIRGTYAERDMAFCEALCRELGIVLQTETCDAPAYAKQTGKTLEEAARELRYPFLERARIACGASVIATAHHADDQAETVLLHLLRGSGTGGLGGMKPRNGRIVRPLLQTTRAEILAYLAERNAGYCEDETNACNDAARNRIRNELLPMLTSYNPAISEALCRTAALCAEDDALLERLASEAEESIQQDGGLNREQLAALPMSLKSRLVRKRIFALDGVVSEPDIRRVLALSEAKTGTAIELSGGYHAWTNATTLFVGRYPEPLDYCVAFVPEGETITPRGVLHSERVASWRKPLDGNEAFLALDALQEELVVRSRKAGDRFYPLGAPGERLLSDVLIDKKIPKEERDRPLLCAGEQVLYAAGLGISERAKVRPDTREILHIQYTGGYAGVKGQIMQGDIAKVLLSEEQIQQRIKELGEQLSKDYANCDGEVILICILKGAVVFFADLARAMNMHMQMEFMGISSYGNEQKTSGIVRITKDIDTSITDKHVIIAEDIMDSGLTLSHLTKLLSSRSPASLKICCLLDKPSRRECDIKPDYYGFIIPNEFVVGYGLDYLGFYRNLPYVGVLKPSVYSGE